MIATLHLPGATPRTLTAEELTSLQAQQGNEVTIDLAAPDLSQLMGTAIPGEVLASGPAYLVVGAENAADYGFAATPSATADFARLTGIEPDDEEPLVGPLLIIEA